MKNKKGQVQMMETLAVLLIFFILVVLGIVFYAKIMKGNIVLEQEESLQLNAIQAAQRASSLPELQCSDDNIVADNCIDLLKLEAASAIILKPENEIYYYDKLLFTKITLQEIYPNERQWLLYERPLEQFSNRIVTNVPIRLFDPVKDKSAFGVMHVEYYTK
jgi:hypothetical protein